MRIYDEGGRVVDLGTVSMEDLNGLMRETIDMMRRQARDPVVRRELEELNEAAVRFTNAYYRHTVPRYFTNEEVDRWNRLVADLFWARFGKEMHSDDRDDVAREREIISWLARGACLPYAGRLVTQAERGKK